MAVAEPSPTPPPPPPVDTRPRNGLGVASLVIGVSSLVAVLSFLLFPVGLVAGVVGIVLGSIALARAESKKATNQGQAIAGLTCSVIAVLLAIVLAVRVGGWIARNTGPLGRLDRCITRSHNRTAVSNCFARFANEVRP